MKKVLVAFAGIILILNGCIKEDLSQDKRNEGQVNIYLVKEGTTIKYSQDIDLNSLEIEEIPWLSSEEIEFYDWSSHMIYLKRDIEREDYAGRHFVIKTEREILFHGIFISIVSSFIPPFPSIMAYDSWFYPSDIIKLGGFRHNLYQDSEEIIKFKSALINSGVYRAGIDVELLEVKRKNSSTVEYTYKITNQDNHPILVLDPDKMGSPRFHYYMNGITLYDNSAHYYAQDKAVEETSGISDCWYYKIRSGEAKTWTVTLGGFTDLPNKIVSASLSYSGANIKEKGSWRKDDGRIWLGDVWIEKEF